jgi:hypothetical protein
MSTKNIKGVLKSSSDIIGYPSLEAFEGTDGQGFYRFNRGLIPYIGQLVDLIEITDPPGYKYQIKDKDGLYIREDWLQSIVVTPIWANVAIDTKVKVKNLTGDPWINGHFAEYNSTTNKIYIWNSGKTSFTITNPSTDKTAYNIGELV